MVAWWWLPIVAWTSFALGMIFWALCESGSETMNEQPEPDEYDSAREAREWKERNDLDMIASSSTR
jgi:hypothetical protein